MKKKFIYAYVDRTSGEILFKRKKPPKTTEHVVVEEIKHKAFIAELNASPDKRAAIIDGEVILEDYIIPATWDHVRFKRDNILRRSDRTVSVPDFHIDGKPITKKQRDDILAYRAKLWTLEADYSKPNEVVWPIPPIGV